MTTQLKKKTISEKLKRKIDVQQVKNETSSLGDIEDIIPEVKSPFFSRPQTRLQSKLMNNPITKIRDLTNVKNEQNNEKKLMGDVNSITNAQLPLKKVKAEGATKAEKVNEINSVANALWKPQKWQEMLDNIRTMRSLSQAPVDTMGCHKCKDEDADRKTQRFQILVSLMLSSQTKDEVTHAAVERLRAYKLEPKIICNMDTAVLEKLIYPVGFYKTKAKNLKNTSRILIEQYDTDIPHSVSELIKLPGVGPKMAHLCMSEAWDEITGVGVDVHVHRISNRLNWVPNATKDPEKTRMALEAWLPRSFWREVNHLLVGFGQTICLPTRPKCNLCLNKNICPSAGKINEKFKSSKK